MSISIQSLKNLSQLSSCLEMFKAFSRLISLVNNIVVNCKLELWRELASFLFAFGSSVGLCLHSPGELRFSLLPTGRWE